MATWAILTGPKGSGKSSRAALVIESLRERGLRVAGFLQMGWKDDLDRKGYHLVRLGTEDRVALARPGREDEPGAFCSFVFDSTAFDTARAWLMEDGVDADVLVIDEVSKLEIAAQGHYQAVQWALASEAKVVLLCVRADQMFFVVEKLGLEADDPPYLEIPASDEDLVAFAGLLAARVSE